ncbi:SMP-30/gluconolactonase/LRE family protein [Williamsia sp. CHRR-6]|uniref:SMP-30/gluconolactonase/LRE family protein n=1 Tax=Williamsia sp. CHRR-6 TaxID=2835871 RepID=UPI001BD93A92|nr:SMP-30/gluconolactonase/LRE family protein [Williamsia sp. CHRR-6]MBT0566408.1 SMP-30/gluconolactonase/LRE family protein [Williamsia sp. CHRR-6]
MPPLRRIELPGPGPEDVVEAPDGRVITGIRDGRILAVDLGSGAVQTITHTGGRPLGLEVCTDSSLLICDAFRGLLRLARIEPGAACEVMLGHLGGETLNFASNVVAHPDGTVYFTTSTRRWDIEQWMGDLLEHSGTGRLWRRTPDGTVSVLRDGLDFANGVAFTPSRDALIVAETAGYRISRFQLTGPDAGRWTTLVDNLPGFPDNISLGSDGLIWVTLAAPRNPMLDALLPRPPWLRRLVWALPEAFTPAPARTAWVLAIDSTTGAIVHDRQRAGTEFALVTGVIERDGTLILGSLDESAIAVAALAD